MRLFIAVPLPRQLKKELAKVQKDFDQFPAKWIKEENLHITLVFIGNIKPDSNLPTQHHTLAYETDRGSAKLGEIAECVRKGITGFPPIKLKIDGLMLFPNEKKVRLLTAKLEGDSTSPPAGGFGEAGTEKLTALVEKIKDGLRARRIGFDEKPFHPHITLTRFKHLRSSERQALKDKVRTFKLPKIEFTADRIELVESKLTPTGPVYSVIAKSEQIR